MSDNNVQVIVRRAELRDSEHICKLCGQLGYPNMNEDVKHRLQDIQDNSEHNVLVAEIEGIGVVGWVHAVIQHSIYVKPAVEIMTLVVDENCRKKGIGKALMLESEHWAKGNGYNAIFLRSGEQRKEAHSLYKRIGYTHLRNHLTFRKEI